MVASCELDTTSIDVSPGRDVRDLSDSQTDRLPLIPNAVFAAKGNTILLERCNAAS